jgi:hypothetical protein
MRRPGPVGDLFVALRHAMRLFRSNEVDAASAGGAMKRVPIVLGLAAASLGGCDGELSLEGRRCPCVEGYACCAKTNLCVKTGVSCELGSLPPGWALPRTLKQLIGVRGGPGDVDGIGREARFSAPGSIVGDDEYLYVSDGGVQSYMVEAQACYSACASAEDPGACMLGYARTLASPVGIRRVSRATGKVEWLVSGQLMTPLAIDEASLYAATANPTGYLNQLVMTCDVHDPYAGRSIVRIDLETSQMVPLAGTTSAGPPTDGVGSSARFQAIRGMVVHAGKLYLTDADNQGDGWRSALRAVDLVTGSVATLAASPKWPGPSSAQADFVGLAAIAARDAELFAIDVKKPSDPSYPDTQSLWRYDLKTGAVVEEKLAEGASRVRDLCFQEDKLWTLDSWCVRRHWEMQAGNDCAWGGSPSFEDGRYGGFRSARAIWCTGTTSFAANASFWPAAYVVDDVTVRAVGWVPGDASTYGMPISWLQTLAGEPSHQGPETVIAPGLQMRIDRPRAVHADAAGTLIIEESGSRLVRVEPGGNVTTYRLTNDASSIAVAPDGALYFVGLDSAIHQLDTTKAFDQNLPLDEAATVLVPKLPGLWFSRLAHDGVGALYAPFGGEYAHGLLRIDPVSGAWEKLQTPKHLDLAGLWVASSDRIFFATIEEHYIGQVGNVIATYSKLHSMDLATGRISDLPVPPDRWQPSALAYHAGVLWVAEAQRSRVRAMVLAGGEILDVVGRAGSKGVQLGSLPASLNDPVGLAILPGGALAIADATENVVLLAE